MSDIPKELTQEYKPGEIAFLDGEHEVTVVGQTPQLLITRVRGLNDDFAVMTYRLSKKQFNFHHGKLK